MTSLCRLVAVALATLVLVGVSVTATPAVADGTDPVGVWPLQPEPEVVRGFDPPDVVWGAGHRGVDLLGTPGQAVHAPLPGTVSFAGVLAGRGVVVVDHGDTRTTYEPVTSSVGVGTVVDTGTVIGTLQTGGSHCPPRACLHWGWKQGETYLDPLRLVGAGPVRLLPLWRDQPLPVVARPFLAVPALINPYASVIAAWAAYVLGRSPPVTPGGGPAGRPVSAGRW